MVMTVLSSLGDQQMNFRTQNKALEGVSSTNTEGETHVGIWLTHFVMELALCLRMEDMCVSCLRGALSG